MKLESITIENFRCFDRLTVELHPELTVLIAPNGGGKTTLLDAARIAVWPFVKAFDLGGQAGKSATIQIEDVRMVKRPNNSMESVIPSKVISTGRWYDNAPDKIWMQTRKQIKPNSNTLYDSATREMIKFGENLQNQVRDVDIKVPVNLPLVAYLGSGRLCYQGRHTSIAKDKMLDRGTYSRTWGYRNCITASSNYKQFEEWYGWVYLSYREQQLIHMEKNTPIGREGLRFKETIEVIQRAVNEVIESETGWKNIAYSQSLGRQIVLSHPEHGDMPLSMLSDGLRNTIAMASDIAFRCVKLNPHYGVKAALKTTGVVMIDEVDMFLHPAWQQRIIGSLQRAFPRIQFIVTTHSPQVLTTVKKESIRILRHRTDPYTGATISSAEIPDTEPKGTASSDVLASLMDIDPVPDIEESNWLSAYKALIQSGAYMSNSAFELRRKLDSHFGKNHQVMSECDRLIRLAEMQKKISFRKQKGQ